MRNPNRTKPAAFLTGALLLTLCAVSLRLILTRPETDSSCIADIYQNGTLLTSIPLDEVREPYVFTITGTEGGENQLEVRPGSIGIISADCPDKLCVRQGFLCAPGIPIVCLPHRLVIQLRPANSSTNSADIDIITY